MILSPQSDSVDGWELCLATAHSQVVVLDPHSSAFLMEIATDHCKFEYKKHALRVWVTRKSVRALIRVVKENAPLDPKKKNPVARSYFSELDFEQPRTVAGGKNAQRFMNQMKLDYEAHCGPLADKKGNIKLQQDLTVNWEELLARSISYFRKYTKGHDSSRKWQRNHSPCRILDIVGFDVSQSMSQNVPICRKL